MMCGTSKSKISFAGLVLLMGSGIHIVWGIFRVFHLYNCKEEKSFYLCLVIWSWYIGAIIGSSCAGYAVAKVRKGHLYVCAIVPSRKYRYRFLFTIQLIVSFLFIFLFHSRLSIENTIEQFTGAGLLIVSGIFLMCSGNATNFWLFTSRIIGGFTQGLVYVVVVVHASENATKEFREFLMLIVGAVLNYSILLSVLAFFHTEGLFSTSLLNGLGLVVFGVCTAMITTKHATETVPFILQNNGSELDALQTVGKLKKKPVAARSVHHDFLVMKNLVQEEMDQYGTPDFRKVLLPENRTSLVFCLYGRLCSVLSFNLPLIVMIMLFLRTWVDGNEGNHKATEDFCKTFSLIGTNLQPGANTPIAAEMSVDNPVRAKRYITDVETTIEKPKFMEVLDEQELNSRFRRETNGNDHEGKGKGKRKGNGAQESEREEVDVIETKLGKNGQKEVLEKDVDVERDKNNDGGEKDKVKETAKVIDKSGEEAVLEKDIDLEKDTDKSGEEKDKVKAKVKATLKDKDGNVINTEKDVNMEKDKDKTGKEIVDVDEKELVKLKDDHGNELDIQKEVDEKKKNKNGKETDEMTDDVKEIKNDKNQPQSEGKDHKKGQSKDDYANKQKTQKSTHNGGQSKPRTEHSGTHKENEFHEKGGKDHQGKNDKSTKTNASDKKPSKETVPVNSAPNNEKPSNTPQPNDETLAAQVAAPTMFAHLLIFLHTRELTLVLLAWFVFGTITAAALYTFNMKRFIYYTACVLSSTLAITGLAHSFHFFSSILHLCLIVYFNYVTIPIDVFGHCMLAEAFPVTLKAFSIAAVAIIEHMVHIIVITLYLSDWFHDSIILFMCIVAFVSHEIARNLPQKGNLPLAEARAQYQNVQLMLFNEPKSGYNQQQEFI